MFLNAAFLRFAFQRFAFLAFCVSGAFCVSRFAFHCVSRSAFVHFAAFWRFAFRCVSRVLRFRAYALKAQSALLLSRLVCGSVAFRSISRFGDLRFAAFRVSAFCASAFCVACVSQGSF